ncbi:MAG: hypothetical protein JRF29_10690, partial [Deltaproteobacteria bacterium]|nr:hypothetical protein [Deltaproteobacteria bacterium]
MLRKSYTIPIIFISILFIQSCASRIAHQFITESQRPSEYERFFNEMDTAVEQAGVRNAAYFQVSGFPYLRANRFLVSLKSRLSTDAQKKQWVRWMQQLDIDARETEIRNLPASAVERLAAGFEVVPDRKLLHQKVISYSNNLLAHDQLRPDFYEVLQTTVHNSSEYSTVMQVFGVYPIASIPVALVTHSVFDEITEWHQLPPDQLQTLGTLTAYGPAETADFSSRDVQKILERSKQNPLGIPIPSEADHKTLLAIFAPLIIQDLAADYDKIGAVVWGQEQIEIIPDTPKAYYYLTHAFYKEEAILQLNYVFWYPARTGPNSPRIERGRIDGFTVRVSLNPAGMPFMVDFMNNCGCYHSFVPRREKVRQILPSPLAIDAFVPTWLPENFPQERLAVRLNSGWHQVENIDAGEIPAKFISYDLIPYRQLEMLPRFDKTTESMFTSTGI